MSASRRLLLLAVLIAALAGFSTWACTATDAKSPAPVPRDDERPPIIISDGSVDFRIDADPGTKGEWKAQTAGVDTAWYHDYSTAHALHHFIVTLVNTKPSPPNTANCANPSHEFTVTTFKIKFKGVLSGGTAVASIKNDHFYLEFADSDASKESDHLLTSKGVPIFHWRKLDSVDLGGGDVCSFAGKSEIHVRQITQ